MPSAIDVEMKKTLLPEHVIVIGGFGFVGGHVVRALVSQGRKVTVADKRHWRQAPTFLSPLIESNRIGFRYFDIASESSIRELLEPADVCDIVNCSAILPGKTRSLEFLEVNGRGPWILCQVASETRVVRRIVHLSSRSVYGRYSPEEGPVTEEAIPRPVDFYGATKAVGDLAIGIHHDIDGLDSVSIRVTGVYGAVPGAGLATVVEAVNPVMAMVAATLNGRPYEPKWPLSYQYEVTYVKDVVRALLKVLEAESLSYSLYNVGSADGQLSLEDIVAQVRIVLPAVRVKLSNPEPDAPPARAALSMARLKQDLGYHSAWSIQHALPDYLGWARHASYGSECGT